MKRWINKEVESRLNAFWEMEEKEDPAHAASPYLNNIEYHYIAANNAEFEEEGGADKFAQSNAFNNANEMMMAVIEQAEEDYECKALEFARMA